MSVEDYIARMKEFGIEREGLETRIKPFYQQHPSQWRESAYLPDGERKSMVPIKPEPESLEHLNPFYYKAAQIHGRKAGRTKREK